MKAIEQYFHVVLFIVLYKTIRMEATAQNFLSCGTVCYAVQGGSNF